MKVGDRVLFTYPEGDADYGVVEELTDDTVALRREDGRLVLTIPEAVCPEEPRELDYQTEPDPEVAA
jgi:hypothetical protein